MKTIEIKLTTENQIFLARTQASELDIMNYDQVVAERDNAWRELRDIRKAIDANPEESTFDEVERVAHKLQSTKTTLEAITALLNPNGYTGLSLVELHQQRLAEAACDGFDAGFLSIGNLTKQNKDYIYKKKSDFIERKYKIKIRKSL